MRTRVSAGVGCVVLQQQQQQQYESLLIIICDKPGWTPSYSLNPVCWQHAHHVICVDLHWRGRDLARLRTVVCSRARRILYPEVRREHDRKAP